MYKNLLHRTTPDVDIFYLLWSNVFSLGQLENVLFSINDLQSSILRETDNSISVLESCGWCQWRKWQSHRCLSSIFKADISRDLGLSFMALGKVEGSHFQQEPIYTVFLFGESSCSLRKSPGSAWLPHLLKTFCSSKFPIT